MGIIHRDIKTENILIDSRENIRIIDFGLTFLGPPDVPFCQWNLHPTEFLGTPPYIAPEVLWNKGLSADRRWPYGVAVDWWALGCILFELESQDHQVCAYKSRNPAPRLTGWACHAVTFQRRRGRACICRLDAEIIAT